jgi:alpha-L-rhamnosidase
MNQFKHLTKLFVVVFLFCSLNVLAKSKNEIRDLVCEYHTNPIGIDVQKPRLSWKIISDEENVIQSAYEIKVTDQTPNGKLIWSSGKVNSDQSVNIAYGGPELKSMQKVAWQVRIWDDKGKATTWSAPATWEMGILESESWKASWITMASEPDIKGSKPSQYLRKEFSPAKKVKSARVYVTSLGLYQLYLNGQKVSTDLFTPGWTSYNNRLQYQTYDVTSMIQSKYSIGAILGDGWYRGNIGGSSDRG